MVDASTSGSASSDIHSTTHSTAHTTILFVLVAVVAGCAIQHFSSRYLKALPFSPAMFVFGIILAVIDRHLLSGENQLHESIARWEAIDGHLLLNIFLPPLLMADSIHLDWHVAKRSASQCFLLAFPGVVFGAFLTAVYASNILPYNWETDLAWSFGAVLAATDPVAVVSLLKELGAPASITMIITGESLLNDGSAMVIWRFFFELHLKTRSLDAASLIAFLFQLALGGIGGVYRLITTLGNTPTDLRRPINSPASPASHGAVLSRRSPRLQVLGLRLGLRLFIGSLSPLTSWSIPTSSCKSSSRSCFRIGDLSPWRPSCPSPLDPIGAFTSRSIAHY